MAGILVLLAVLLGVAALAGVLPRLVGPLFEPELARLTARWPFRGVRIALSLVLALIFLVTYSSFFGPRAGVVSHSDMARFAETLFIALLVVQLIAVALLTPPVVASALSREKHCKTLDLLRATPLTGREIALGKLAARLVPVFDVVLAGLPLIAAGQFFGGVDFLHLILGYGVTLLFVLSVGAWSLFCGGEARTLRGALMLAYTGVAVVSLGPLCCLATPGFAAAGSPFAFIAGMFSAGRGAVSTTELLSWFAGFAGAHGLLATFTLLTAISALSNRPVRMPSPPEVTLRPAQTAAGGAPPAVVRPPLTDDGLLWKEKYGAPVSGCALVVPVVLALGTSLTFVAVFVPALLRGESVSEAANLTVRIAGEFLLIGGLFSVGLQAAGSVSSEREKGTLEGLFLLPIDRGDILDAKYRGALWHGRLYAYGLVGLLALGVLTGGLHPVAAVVLGLLVVMLGVTVARLGVVYSVECRTTGSATVMFVVTALFVSLPPLCFCWPGNTSDALSSFGPSVPLWWWNGARDFTEGREASLFELWSGNGGLLVALVYAVSTLFLWDGVRDSFNREQARLPRPGEEP